VDLSAGLDETENILDRTGTTTTTIVSSRSRLVALPTVIGAPLRKEGLSKSRLPRCLVNTAEASRFLK
jgi:hypothetical protein